jgi:WD40 repeat protein
MSTPFDRLLVDPDETTVFRTLEEAICSSKLSFFGGQDWSPILDKLSRRSVGRSQIECSLPDRHNTSYLAVAWWTDHRGGRHVRVCGGNIAEGRHPHYSWMNEEDTRPPLWHVYPEYVYHVHRAGNAPVWLASCDCGATGAPETLAWMGSCCGPCHDRRQDGELVPGSERRTILDQQNGPIGSLAFSPDGNTLAVSAAGRRLHRYDFRDGNSELLYSSESDYERDEELRPVLFSPDERFLAAGEHDVWSARVWYLEQTEFHCEALLFANDSRVEALAFSPDSRQLAAVTSVNGLIIWRHMGGEWHDQEYSQQETVNSVDFSPDGKTLALGGVSGEVIVIDFPTWKVAKRLVPAGAHGEDVLYLHYTPTGTGLVAITGNTEAVPSSETWTLRLWDLTTRDEQVWTHIPVLSALAMSPDGQYLAWIVHDRHCSPAEVTIWDLHLMRAAGWLEWNVEDDLRELAFSPDGQTLAIGSESGVVKLVPWRLLLEG